MSDTTQQLKNLIVEQVKQSNDAELLDLIYKLLISQ